MAVGISKGEINSNTMSNQTMSFEPRQKLLGMSREFERTRPYQTILNHHEIRKPKTIITKPKF